MKLDVLKHVHLNLCDHIRQNVDVETRDHMGFTWKCSQTAFYVLFMMDVHFSFVFHNETHVTLMWVLI